MPACCPSTVRFGVLRGRLQPANGPAPHLHPLAPRYVLKNVARDWSAEGAGERAASYGRIVAELQRLFKDWPADAPEPPSVLVPGAGLARLCLEIVNLVSWWEGGSRGGAQGTSEQPAHQPSS